MEHLLHAAVAEGAGLCRTIAPKAAFKAHEGEVLSATLSLVPTGAPEAGPLRLITAGEV